MKINNSIAQTVLSNGIVLTMELEINKAKSGDIKDEKELIRIMREICDTYEELSNDYQNKIEEIVNIAYKAHKSAVEQWRYGEPVEAEWNNDNVLCVKYESGKWWHYKDLDLPFPTWY